jgi:probable F420-dependent oxidoreductase
LAAGVRVGVVFPHTEIEPDAGAIRAWTAAVAELGFDHVLVYDHVTGVDPRVHPNHAAAAHSAGATSSKPYDVADRFHELMVLLGFLAGITSSLELISGVLVLPQRQTALVAKQAAEVDLLSGGRLRLGVGVGWNELEHRSLGQEFSERGDRIEEQIELLRRYWTEPTVRYQGRWDWAQGVGISPLPVQRPIPIWIAAGASTRAQRRVGRLGDGWLPVATSPQDLGEQLERIRAAAAAAGRDPAALGIQGRTAASEDVGVLAGKLEAWRDFGASHVAIDTMRRGLEGADQHVGALRTATGAFAHAGGDARARC